MKLRLFKISYFLILGFFLFPLFTNGQVTIENPLKYNTFKDLVNALINFIFVIGIAVAPIMALIAGFNLLTSGGDPKKIDTAKKILLYTVLGLAIILMAKGLIGVLNNILGVQAPAT